jgi:hypothetical protein
VVSLPLVASRSGSRPGNVRRRVLGGGAGRGAYDVELVAVGRGGGCAGNPAMGSRRGSGPGTRRQVDTGGGGDGERRGTERTDRQDGHGSGERGRDRGATRGKGEGVASWQHGMGRNQ